MKGANRLDLDEQRYLSSFWAVWIFLFFYSSLCVCVCVCVPTSIYQKRGLCWEKPRKKKSWDGAGKKLGIVSIRDEDGGDCLKERKSFIAICSSIREASFFWFFFLFKKLASLPLHLSKVPLSPWRVGFFFLRDLDLCVQTFRNLTKRYFTFL